MTSTRGWKVSEWKRTGVRVCRMCGETKPVSDFYLMATGYLDPRCRPCCTIRRAEYRNRTRVEHIRYRRKRNLKRFGITEGDYQAMLVKQGGGCGICKKPISWGSRRLSVDHCHKTGAVRGLLCSACNTSIGQMDESLSRLQQAMDYLRSHGATWQ